MCRYILRSRGIGIITCRKSSPVHERACNTRLLFQIQPLDDKEGNLLLAQLDDGVVAKPFGFVLDLVQAATELQSERCECASSIVTATDRSRVRGVRMTGCSDDACSLEAVWQLAGAENVEDVVVNVAIAIEEDACWRTRAENRRTVAADRG